MTLRLRSILPIAVAALLALAACSSPTASSPPAETAEAIASDSPLALSAMTLDGTNFDGSTLAGEPVVMWFWAPWCTVCRAESPDVAAVAEEFEGRVTFIGVGGRGPIDDMRAFVEETDTEGFTHLADEEGSVWTRFGIVAQPSFVFVAADGRAESFAGSLTADALRNVANGLLAP